MKQERNLGCDNTNPIPAGSLSRGFELQQPEQPRSSDLRVDIMESTSMRRAMTNWNTRMNCMVLTSRVSRIIPRVQVQV